MRGFQALSLLALAGSATAFDYELASAGVVELIDTATGIAGLSTMFIGEEVNVTVIGVEWVPKENITDDTTLFWSTSLNGVVQETGNYSLADVGRELPTSFKVGQVKTDDKGTTTIAVTLSLDEIEQETSEEYTTYAKGVSIVPLIIILVLAMSTRMVEFSLYTGIFIGSCIINGNVNEGFKRSLDQYILEALADVDHVYVILFTLFLSGLVGMMQKSGGMIGFTKDCGKIAKTARLGQTACFLVGLFIFFDDYANVLLAGETMRPLLDTLFVSREKLAFIVDATSAPVASISPISSWVGFEVGLIQNELDKIVEIFGEDALGNIKSTGFGVFLQSIKYRYYPIFMLIFVMLIIFSQRDFGPMLVAERKARVYKITDGGDGKGRGGGLEEENKPCDDTPKKSWNMVLPVLLLIFLIFWLLVQTGTIEGVSQTFMEKIENSDSYSSMLWGTMGTVMLTIIFYLLQIVRDGHLIIPRCGDIKLLLFGRWMQREEDEENLQPIPRFIMSVYESIEAFLFGMGRIFPAIIVLTLAWASGALMVDIGADRLFAGWIVGGVPPEMLPTLSFIVSLFMALATGTSWGTMSILFPLLIIPTFIASNGDALIFNATVAGVLSGSVAGDHMSPISDTTVLSSLACDCDLVSHVSTQAPYALVMSLFAILFGTLPIGYSAWPNIIGYLLGWLFTGIMVYTLAVRIINATGRFSIFLEGWLRWVKKGNSELEVLRVDTVKAYNDEEQPVSRFKLPWKKGDEASEEDNLVETKAITGSEGDESPANDVEEGDEVYVDTAEEAVPVEDPMKSVTDSMPPAGDDVKGSMHSEYDA